MRVLLLVVFIVIFTHCRKKVIVEGNLLLSNYFEKFDSVHLAHVTACAAGTPNGINNDDKHPTSIFLYPLPGTTNYRYFETNNIKDSLNFSKYFEKKLEVEPFFNGYLKKFNNPYFEGERMGIVTIEVDGELHVSTPIRLKTNKYPTELNSDVLTINQNGITPNFTWVDGSIPGNVIYFQVISDTLGNFISGTYTNDKTFTFYDLSNVVFNITDPNTTPALTPNQKYNFTFMCVSADNWVNLYIQTSFRTD